MLLHHCRSGEILLMMATRVVQNGETTFWQNWMNLMKKGKFPFRKKIFLLLTFLLHSYCRERETKMRLFHGPSDSLLLSDVNQEEESSASSSCVLAKRYKIMTYEYGTIHQYHTVQENGGAKKGE